MRARPRTRLRSPLLFIVLAGVGVYGAAQPDEKAIGAIGKISPAADSLSSGPLAAQLRRLLTALDAVGAPLAPSDRQVIEKALDDPDGDRALRAIQGVLDSRVLVEIQINPESRVRALRGPAVADLDQRERHAFLVKVRNEGGVTAPLAVHNPSPGGADRPSHDRWSGGFDVQMFAQPPMVPELSGFPLEYRILQLYSRDAGQREARLSFDVGQGTQDLGFRSDVDILFAIRPRPATTHSH